MSLAFDIDKHFLVPKHVLLSKKDIAELIEKTGFKTKELPRISSNDPAIKHLNAKKNDMVKIIRFSRTAGKSIYYRQVV